MYILAYGQCKTVYQYVDKKSTKVNKYANKCLKTDLPQSMNTGPINYKTLAREKFEACHPELVEETRKRLRDQQDPQNKDISEELKQ